MLGQPHHIDFARALRREIKAHHLFHILGGKHGSTEVAQAPANLTPGPGQRGQTGHGPDGRRSSAVALDADAGSDRSRPGRRIGARQVLNSAHRNVARLRQVREREGAQAAEKWLGADGMPLYIVKVGQPLFFNDLHHGQGQGRVGSRPDGNMIITRPGGPRTIRVNGNQPRPAPLGLTDEWPDVKARVEWISGPEDNEFTFNQALWSKAKEHVGVIHCAQ